MKKVLWLTMLTVIIGMFAMIVSAKEEFICSEEGYTIFQEQIGNTRVNYHEFDRRFDFNEDGIINLVDVGIYAKLCPVIAEEPEEEPLIEEPVIKTKRTTSIHVSKGKDGSYIYRSYGTSIQHVGSNMIVRNPEGYEGTTCWSYNHQSYCGTFFKSYGYNYIIINER